MEKMKKNVGMTLVFSLLLCLTGCGLTLGPVTETRYVLIKPGVPVVILENKVIKCRVLVDADGGVVKQDVGGWVAMPPSHWEQVKADLLKGSR